jgi:hypothetical protein
MSFEMSEPLVGYKKRLRLENQKKKEILKAKEKEMKKKQKSQGRFTRKVI